MPGDTAFWRDPLPHVESRRACRSRACYKPHSHPTYSIGAVDAGGSVFTGSHGRQPLSARQPGAGAGRLRTRLQSLPGAHWSYQMLHLDARWVQGHAPRLRTDSATVLHAPALYAQFCSMNALLFSVPCGGSRQRCWLSCTPAPAGQAPCPPPPPASPRSCNPCCRRCRRSRWRAWNTCPTWPA
jgi:hypothetical protein